MQVMTTGGGAAAAVQVALATGPGLTTHRPQLLLLHLLAQLALLLLLICASSLAGQKQGPTHHCCHRHPLHL
jgi:hypothetical protein